jgi:penicillin-binding protein 2
VDNRSGQYSYTNRRLIIIGVIIALLLFLLIRLFILQIVSNDYAKWAYSNAFQRRTLYPARGVIYDRQERLLVYNQPSYDIMFIDNEVKQLDTVDFCATINISKENFKQRMANIKDRNFNPGYSRFVPQVFMNQLSSDMYGVLQEKLYKFPGFYIRNRALREYGYTVGANLLGYVGEVNRKDIEADDYFVSGDYSGRSGVERSYEKVLRGEKGVEILLRDVHGVIKGKFEEGKHDEAPVSGKNITLAIDIELQAFGEALMGTKRGSIVMIEPSTGEVLCLVTAPSYDPGLLNGRQRITNYLMLERDPNKPLLDRSIMGSYSPGSTFKPAQGLIFLQEGVINRDKLYSCAAGYPYLGGHPACHSHFSPLSIVPALATSCNAFFCWGLHDMLDSRSRHKNVQEAFEVWKNYMVSMGYGYPLGIDLPGEIRGFIPNSNYYNKVYNNRWNSSSIVSISIGQGEINATPLQICNLAATIANRGYYITPHIVREIQDMELEEKYRTRKYTGIDEQYYNIVAEGMRGAVTGGTCTRLYLPDIEVCGKTGTVQNPHGRDHSACISFAPYKNPKVAIAVFIENGGWGATVSVPMARLMLEKYLYGEIPYYDKYLVTQMTNWDTSSNSPYYIKKDGNTVATE